MTKKTRSTTPVQIGTAEHIITVGGNAPVVVQSMTNTDTADVYNTVKQVMQLAKSGSEMVRITVNSAEAAAAVATIRSELDRQGCFVPLIGDFHFNGHKLLNDYPECAQALAKYRINPGNVGKGKKRDDQFSSMIEVAIKNDKPVRIGVNWGSLDQALLARIMDENSQLAEPLEPQAIMHKAMVTSALESAKQAEAIGLAKNKIILSVKMSSVQDLISVYRELADKCDYALHTWFNRGRNGLKRHCCFYCGSREFITRRHWRYHTYFTHT